MLAAACLFGCSPRLSRLQKGADARVEVAIPLHQAVSDSSAKRDTMAPAERPVTFTTAEGEELLLVPVSYDEQLQESMMSLQIEQVTISVRNIRNVAERNGKIDLEFSVTIPHQLLDDEWRVELEPVLCMPQDTFSLQRLMFTGERFRKLQQKDKAKFERYLSSIVDSADYFRYFGDNSGLEQYLSKAAARRRRLIDVQQHLSPSDAAKAAYDQKIYSKGLRRLEKYQAREERRRSKTELPEYDAKGAVDRLNAYLSPRFNEPSVPEEVQKLRQELSDSAKMRHYRIRERNIAANIRMLGALDTAALMQEYYDMRKIERNEARARNKDTVFKRIVRFPELPDTKLDTLVHADRSVTYRYRDQLDATENTNKLFLFLQGMVTTTNGRQYRLPASDTLTYSVTSMTSFIDPSPRYVQRIVKRDAEANARFYFIFPQGKARFDVDMGDNAGQLGQIRALTQELMTDPVFIIDSITLTATSSPEGAWRTNDRLSRDRSAALKEVLEHEFRQLRDSLEIAGSYVLDTDGQVRRVEQLGDLANLSHILRSAWQAEDWDYLRELIVADTSITDKTGILSLIDEEPDPDRREHLIRKRFPADYASMRQRLYPRMRAVDFRFSLHRRGMKQDTVWTTELDSSYMRGVDLLRKRRYEEALALLRPYEDRNTALAYMSVGLDRAAARILKQEAERETEDADSRYMLAVVTARLEDEQTAVQNLLRAVELKPHLRFRANLDPELATLVRRYALFND